MSSPHEPNFATAQAQSIMSGRHAVAGGIAVAAAVAALALLGSAPAPALVVAAVALGCGFYALLGLTRQETKTTAILSPVLFAALLLFAWEAAVRGFAIPMILLPAPSDILVAFWRMLPLLAQDAAQTVLFGALPGFLIGTAVGFLAAMAADRFAFLRLGLLPLSNFASVIPIVGVAPIMIMWFGLGGTSKAAVVVLITFFPAFVNMLAGLQQASATERDLMMSYAATPAQTLRKLRLPAALPFLFAALKINASLALIGAIVAEFFGTPLFGIGFRISTEIGHLSLDNVWAAIVVAALAGSISYALLSLAERTATFWHPSQLRQDRPR